MKNVRRSVLAAAGVVLLGTSQTLAQDWPQWRGPNRDAHVTGFQAPSAWPSEFAQKWKVAVGDGVSTPALVGDKLFVFTREGKNEVIRGLDATTGKEIWQDKYEAEPATRPAQNFPGPRSSPTVSDGKVVTLGVRGTLSCLDAATGKVLWRKAEVKGGWPQFFASSSPLVVDGHCIAQAGGDSNGEIVAYDLSTGEEKWKWAGDSTAYSSLSLMNVGSTKLVIGMMKTKMVAVNAADGKLLWQAPFPVTGRGYNAATPIVDGQTLIYAGSSRGVTAMKFEMDGDKLVAKELWKNPDRSVSVMFNTPVIKDELIYGLSQTNDLFCINLKTGKTAWSAPIGAADPAGGAGKAGGGGGKGKGKGGGGGMMGGTDGYGSIVDAGSVLLALTPGSQLVVFKPNDSAFTEQARIKVASSPTYAYPILAGNRLFVKDKDSVTLLAIQ
jgi:outer membrane protein assembly factor BamB